MFFPFTKKEEEDAVPGHKAQRFLGRIRRGMSDLEAAAAVGIDEEELRRLRRMPQFRGEVKRARREGPRKARLIILDQFAPSPYDPPPPGMSDDALDRLGWRRYE
jgi:hypothetical protein